MKCPQCGLSHPDPFFASNSASCPNCGHRLEDDSDAEHPISGYWNDLKILILKPKEYFRTMPRNGGLAEPLAFALIAHWVGSAFAYLWHQLSARTAEQAFEQWSSLFGGSQQIDVIRRSGPWLSARHALTDWIWGMGAVITDPFTQLLWIFITSFFVFLGARLLVGAMSDAPRAAPEDRRTHSVSFESALRIIAFGKVASIFLAVPLYGSFISWIYGLYISTVGAKEIYRIRTGRALTVVLFPQVLCIIGLFLLIALIMLLAVGFLGSIFSTSF